MKVWQRLVSLLNGIVLLGLFGVFIMIFLGRAEVLDSYASLTTLGYWWIFGITVVSALLSFFSFKVAFYRRRQEKTIINQTQFGEIRIAVSAIESLALRATKRIKGVKDAHIGVRADLTGIDVFIEISVLPDLGIPQITEEIRAKVDEYILETVGIKINSVKVLVTKVANEAKTRVE